MSVLMVNTYHHLRGGDSRYALGLSELLEDAGLDVLPFAMRHPENFQSPYTEFFAEENDYPKLMQEGGARAAWTVMQRSIFNRQARAQLRALLGVQTPRLAHLHSVMHHLTASVPMELYRQGIPVVWTLHDLKSVCPTTTFVRDGQICEACSGGRFYNALRYRCKRGSLGASAIVTAELYLHRLWKVYERADLLIAPSRFLRDKVVEAGLRPRRIEVLHNFVQVRPESPDAARDYVLFVGRLDSTKGVEELCEASAQAGGVPLRIVGIGELSTRLEERIHREGWEHVELLGYRDGVQLDTLYERARLVAVPSTVQENCPMVVLESFAHGRPVLASAIGGMPELVEPGITGALVPPGDVAALADRLRVLYDDPATCRELGEQARARAVERFSPEAHRTRILEFYDELVPNLVAL